MLMPRPKKPRLIDASSETAVVLPPRRSRRLAGRLLDATFDDLGVDVLAIIHGFLGPFDIMRSRVCKKISKVATTAIVPLTEYKVDEIEKVHALRAMSTALPNLQEINLHVMEYGHRFDDGEDPDESMAARTANETIHDIEILSRFRKLRILGIYYAPLNGRYPFLFNFPLLQKLKIDGCHHLKWNLEMLAGFPLLKELYCNNNESLTGNINSLRVLKDTLEKVTIAYCFNVQGNFMDLADFPCLKELNLEDTGVTGDIRDIGGRAFSTLESVTLPDTVYGGIGYELQRISDAPGVINALYSLKKQRPRLLLNDWHGKLSEDSPDWYDGIDITGSYMDYEYMDYDEIPAPPMYIVFVEAGSRIGYRWESADSSQHPCEVNWLDPEPDRESNDYEKYTEELHKIERQVNAYRGFHQPPSETEYQQLCEERLF